MSSRYFRIQPADRDTAALLDPARWNSRNHGGEKYIDGPNGEEIEDVRHGVSVCESVEELATYIAQSGVPVADQAVIVELEADLADDEDHDAHLGARLVHPTAIIGTTVVGDEFYDLVNAAHDAIYA